MAGVVIGLFVAWYFLDLYDSGSDFYTSDFYDLDAFLFFGIALLGVAPRRIKEIMDKMNVTRPLDTAFYMVVLFALA